MNTKTAIRSGRVLACMGAAALFTLGLPASASASAADMNVRTTSVVVKFGELDLAKPEGISELYRRIQKAADKACGGIPTGQPFSYKRQYQKCREVAIADAVGKVHNGQLTAFHESAMGKNSRNG